MSRIIYEKIFSGNPRRIRPNKIGDKQPNYQKVAHDENLQQYEPIGLGRFATDHSFTKAASRPLFARVRRYAPQRALKNHI